LYKEQPGQFRAELHDRLVAPLYPLAMVVIVYAYLGAPRTTRQSRAVSMVSAIAAVAGLRMVGFASTIFAVHVPLAVLFPYAALGLAFGFGYLAISRGVILEPPALITNAIAALGERIARRVEVT
jgi:lipopolysaccharide export system permease protein